MSSNLFESLQKAGDEIFGPGTSMLHASLSPVKCDHDWPQNMSGVDVNANCMKCNISFMRYAFTECP